jgi:hypothetical protein
MRPTKEIINSIYDEPDMKMPKSKVLSMMKDLLMMLPATDKSDVMSITTREQLTNRVWTKKMPIGVEIQDAREWFENHCFEFVSISGYNRDVSDASINDIRFVFTDRSGEWKTVYANNFDVEEIEFVYKLMKKLNPVEKFMKTRLVLFEEFEFVSKIINEINQAGGFEDGNCIIEIKKPDTETTPKFVDSHNVFLYWKNNDYASTALLKGHVIDVCEVDKVSDRMNKNKFYLEYFYNIVEKVNEIESYSAYLDDK